MRNSVNRRIWIQILCLFLSLMLLPSPDGGKAAGADQLTYTNLVSESSIREVQEILTKAGIQAKHVDTVLEWVTDYNHCMRECSAFSLADDFVTIDGTTVDYGEYYPKSIEWYRRNNRNYPDVLCRVAAFQLVQDNISVKEALTKDRFACWDENTTWLYTDGDILFGREAEAYDSYPLIDWSDDRIADYFTLFDPVPISEGCNEQEMLQAIREKWSGRGVSFAENAFSLITFWTQDGNITCTAHAAALIETDSGYLLFEKTNPMSPYAATKFSSTEEVKQYLYDMMELDYSRYNSPVGTYVILRNDRLL